MITLENTDCIICGASDYTVVATGSDYLYKTVGQQLHYVQCKKCGHLYLNPRPTIDQIGNIYPKNYSSFSGKFSKNKSLIARLKDQVLLSRFNRLNIDKVKGLRVLDVGCGDGRFLISLRQHHPDFVLHGLDWNFSAATFDALKSDGIFPIVGTAEDMKLENEFYDVIVMNQLVEHLWEPREALKRCFNALRPGGTFVLETPDPDGYDRLFFFRSGLWGSYYWPRHLNLFSGKLLSCLLVEIGFVDTRKTQLLAPMCWIYSIISTVEKHNFHPSYIRTIVRDDKVWVLAPFATLDWVLGKLGFNTSNQKMAARKPGNKG
jgi:SAM-dependent methyltransferase